jgi:hypothetical protein
MTIDLLDRSSYHQQKHSLSIVEQNIMQKQTSLIFALCLAFLAAFGANNLSPQPAQAATLEEIGKIFGIWHRYIQDINKTMNQTPQTNPQPTPTIQPEATTATPSTKQPQPTEIQIPE